MKEISSNRTFAHGVLDTFWTRLNLASFVNMLKIVANPVRNYPVARNRRQNTPQLSFLLKFQTFVKGKAGAKHPAQLSCC